MDPIFHPQTKLKIESFLKQPAHGVLLSGKAGSGKHHIAGWLAGQLGGDVITIEVPEAKSTISIEQIRELYTLTRTANSLVIIIKDGHLMGTEAQNAFLKLLEEPPQHTSFILTAHSPQDVLSTIRSRTQLIEVLPPLKEDLMQAVDTAHTAQAKSLVHTSEGLAGTFFRLLEEEAYQSHQVAVTEAKQFYTSTAYQRHLICAAHSYDKEWAWELLRLLSLIIRSLLKNTVQSPERKPKLTSQAELIELTAHRLFEINGNPKIHLAKLCEQLG